jgi:hypothetical protein
MKENLDISICRKIHNDILMTIDISLDQISEHMELYNINSSLKNVTIDHSIALTIAYMYDKFQIQNISNYLTAVNHHNLPVYIIDDNYRSELIMHINTYIDRNKSLDSRKVFIIDNTHAGRYELFYTSLIFTLKFIFNNHIDDSVKNQFEEYILENYHPIINNAILLTLCYESDSNNQDMCKKLLIESNHDYSNNINYQYRLEQEFTRNTKKIIHDFSNSYIEKQTDKIIQEDTDIILALSKTLNAVKDSIEEIYTFNDYKENPLSVYIYNEYKDIFSNLKDKIYNSKKRTKLLLSMKQSRMNYILKNDGEYLYPFLYDFLVIRFSLLIKTAVNNELLHNQRAREEERIKTDEEHHKPSSNENYLSKELTKLIACIPDEYINKMYIDDKYMKNNYDSFSKTPTKFLVKYYCQILNTDYKYVAQTISRLLFDLPRYNSTYFYEPKYLIDKKLEIDDTDNFRILSINII